ncbi:MAG: DUF4295 domain-containing protein [Bacteroidales bacterium]|jgi:hypothetical protein|nr:DUF4295 domain-containing protein [Bacteroidales bacterium]MBQ1637207.1 DUF4295 domain-containing protein [Bacteroidales bacterium]MBQ1679760.1 DUF4295 domain-containing protein [Bacteroidales bacterium]MBQ1753720.1 DUF4295 domain-containing protein [Bacteroidales bacterium]MBQ1831800.1 DUF4295 domain-containing protein [Bacteroidales bacterium]
MAKKAVATFSGDKSQLKNVVKCIKMVKSPRTGAYAFEEQLVPTEEVADYFKK